MNAVTTNDFLSDHQGRRFSDVTGNPDLNWSDWVDWLNDADRQARLEIAEEHFDMPALAGVLRELEREDFVKAYFDPRSLHETRRVKQALGVLVRLHMEARGWSTTGRKGALGRRDNERQGAGQHNTPRSFSRYIQSAERYVRPQDTGPLL